MKIATAFSLAVTKQRVPSPLTAAMRVNITKEKNLLDANADEYLSQQDQFICLY